eukprot:CAMPEP_0115060302 /NCGR_PEP_ID=MMETSP0227-20121206/7392_1 /TAXON_ID=89957 /ORGANISM="Polarella glacialis, Strain CCMP 1383" /LENGTH=175 /DNA_ID=CAMNT_0002445509 /DNA_START=218 /DNA_END=745 /DNA_ORIENTATION=+
MSSSRSMLAFLVILAIPAAGAAPESCQAGEELTQAPGRPSALVQMKAPRKSAPAVEEEPLGDSPTPQEPMSLEAATAAERSSEPTPGPVVLQKISAAFQHAASWNPHAAWGGDLSESNMMVLPAALAMSLILSCALATCFVMNYRPKRGKLDSQFEPCRLGLPADYGKPLRTNCW